MKTLCKFVKKIGFTLIGISLSVPVWGNPSGANVVRGTATFSNPNANTLNVTNSAGAIINWQNFSIQANEITNFIQPSSASAVLNRVVGNNLSELYGQLNSNGRVFLINQNGIMLGANGSINTAGFVASTLNITDDDFINGNYHFVGGGLGDIETHGAITSAAGGEIVLVAPKIENHGTLSVDGGSLILAAGEEVTLTSFDLDGIQFEVQAPENEVLNLGELLAESGSVGVFAGSLQQDGIIEANSIGTDAQGNIVLFAQSDIDVGADALITANGDDGGSITLQSETGDTVVRGTVEAIGVDEQGGDIKILGDRVGLFGQAKVDASGEQGGGEVLIGGDYQGQGDIQTAQQSQVGAQASIHADAITSGDGGRAIVWADGFTEMHGLVTAQGGANAGDGGFIEVSGKDALVFNGFVDTSAVNGAVGTVLFDPRNISIFSGAVGTYDGTADDEFLESPSSDVTFSNASIASVWGSQNVILQANNDISLSGSLFGTGNNLTLQAGRSINIFDTQTGLTTGGGDLILIANSTLADGVVDAQRLAGPAAVINLGDGVQSTSIQTGGGNMVFEIRDGAGLTNNSAGLITVDNLAFLDSGNGDIVFRADSGMDIITGGSVNAGTGTVFIEPYTAGTTIGVEGGVGTLAVADAVLERISSAGTVQIGSTIAGPISLGGVLTGANYNNLTFLSDGDIIREDFAPDFNMDFFGAGNTLTLRSLNGNIRFVNNSQVIETDGPGNIVLDAPNGSLLNLGQVSTTTAGGSVTLTADGNIELNADVSSGFGAGMVTIDSASGQIIQSGGNIITAALTVAADLGFNLTTFANTSLSFDNSGNAAVQITNNASKNLSITGGNNAATGFSTIIQEQSSNLSIDGAVSHSAGFGTTFSAAGDLNINANITGTGGGGTVLGITGAGTITNSAAISDNGGVVLSAKGAGGTITNAASGTIDNAASANDILLDADNITLVAGGNIDAGALAKTILRRKNTGAWSLGFDLSGDLDTVMNHIAIGDLTNTVSNLSVDLPATLTNSQNLDIHATGTVTFTQSAGNHITGANIARIFASNIVNSFSGGSLDVGANTLELHTSNGVGASKALLETQVGQLLVNNTASGGIYITNNHAGGLNVFPTGVQNAASAGGVIDLVNVNGDFVINGLIAANGDNITITNNDAGADIIVNTDVLANTAGNITLDSQRSIIANATSIGTSIQADSGDVTLNAVADVHLIGGSGVNESVNATVISSSNQLNVTTGGNLLLQAGTASGTQARLSSKNDMVLAIGGDASLVGGDFANSEAGIGVDGTLNFSIGNNLLLDAGDGDNSAAVIGQETNGKNTFVQVLAGGNVTLLGGAGVDAAAAIGVDSGSIDVDLGTPGTPIGGDINFIAGSGGVGTQFGAIAAIGALGTGDFSAIDIYTDGSLVMQSDIPNGNDAMIGATPSKGGAINITAGLGSAGGNIDIGDGSIATAATLTLDARAGGGLPGDIGINNGGVDVGALNAIIGGQFTMAAGGMNVGNAAASSLTGVFDMTGGAVSFAGATSVANQFGLAGGTLDVAGTLDIASAAAFDYAGGTLQGSGSVNLLTGSTMNVTGGQTPTVLIDNDGTVVVDPSSILTLGPGTTHAGVFNLSAADSLLDFASGTHNLSGASATTGPGLMQVTGATVNVSATNSIGNALVDVQSGTLDFAAATTLSNAILGGGSITSTAPLTISTQLDWTGGTFGTSALVVNGVTNMGAGTFSLGTANLNGTVNFVSGTDLTISGTNTHGGDMTLGAGSTLTLNTGAQSLNGTIVVNGGTLNADSLIAVGNQLDLDAGTLNVSNQLRLVSTSTFNFNGGILTGAGTLPILPTTTMNVSGAQSTNLILINDGTVNLLASSSLGLNQGATHAGIFNLTAADSVLDFAAGTHDLTAASATAGPGVLRVTGATVNVAAKNSIGNTTVDVQSGTLDFALASGLTDVLLSGGQITSSAPVAITNQLNWSGGTFGTSNLVVTGTTNVAAGAFALGTSSLNGVVNLASGSDLTITGTNTHGGDFTLGAGSVLTFGTGTQTLNGTTTVTGGILDITGTVNMGSTGVFDYLSGTLQGTGNLNLLSGSTMNVTGTVVPSFMLDNDGTVNVLASSNLGLSQGTAHAGVFNLTAADSILDFTAGTHDLTAATATTGPGRLLVTGATVNVAAKNSIGNTVVDVQSGTLDFALASILNDVRLRGNGGGAGGQITSSAPLTISNNFNLTHDGSKNAFVSTTPITVGGTWSIGPGDFDLSNVVNNAAATLAAGTTLTLGGGGSHGGSFATVAGSGLRFNGGLHTVTGGISGAGALILDGPLTVLNLNAKSAVGQLALNAGTLAGNRTLTVTEGAVINGGTIGANLTLETAGGLDMAGAFALNGTLNNRDAAIWSAPGGDIFGSGTFNNTGTGILLIENNHTMNPLFINRGLTVKANNGITTFGSDYQHLGGFTIVDQGAFAIAGQMLIDGGNVKLGSGTLLEVAGPIDFTRGKLKGFGTVRTPLLNHVDGVLAPGALFGDTNDPDLAADTDTQQAQTAGANAVSNEDATVGDIVAQEAIIGRLIIDGDYVMGDSAVINLDLAGSVNDGAAGEAYDLLRITDGHDVAFNGSLKLVVNVQTYRGELGDRFSPIRFEEGRASGGFNSIAGLPGGYAFEGDVNAGRLVFSITESPFKEAVRFTVSDEQTTLNEIIKEEVQEKVEEKRRKKIQQKAKAKKEEQDQKRKVLYCS